MRPEETIEKKFVKECFKLGVKAFKFEVDGLKGAPDRMVLIPGGHIIFIEFKKPGGGIVGEHQLKFINKLNELGFTTMIVDSWEYPLQVVKSYLEISNG